MFSLGLGVLICKMGEFPNRLRGRQSPDILRHHDEPVLDLPWEHPGASIVPWMLMGNDRLRRGRPRCGWPGPISKMSAVYAPRPEEAWNCSQSLHSVRPNKGEFSLLPTLPWAGLGRIFPTTRQLTIDV